jgi:GST-like protein
VITLYGLSSPNVMKIAIALEEMGLAYELVHFDIFEGKQFEKEFARLNPNGKVPVLVDDDAASGPIFESCAILLYLSSKTGLFNPDPLAVSQWLFFQAANIGPAFGQAMHFLSAAPAGNDYALSRHLTEVRRIFGVADRRLAESAHLGADDYSIADMAAFPWVRMHDQYTVDLAGFPNVRRWLTEVGGRDAVADVVERWPALKAETLANRAKASPDQLDRVYGRGRFGTGGDLVPD